VEPAGPEDGERVKVPYAPRPPKPGATEAQGSVDVMTMFDETLHGELVWISHCEKWGVVIETELGVE
jgi:hypothetical protein